MDFIGAARSEGEPAIIYISSEEEEMEILSSCSVDDLYLSSEDETEEVKLMLDVSKDNLQSPSQFRLPQLIRRRKDL